MSSKMGCEHRNVPATSYGARQDPGRSPQGRAAVSSGSPVRRAMRGGGKGTQDYERVRRVGAKRVMKEHIWDTCLCWGRLPPVLKSKDHFSGTLISTHICIFVEEITFNLQIPCGAYSALIPGVGIRAPCADRGEDRPLQCGSLSVNETQNQALQHKHRAS